MNFILLKRARLRLLLLPILLLSSILAMAQSSAIIGTGTANTNGNGSDPIDAFYESLHYQTVYTATELLAAGMTGGSTITSLGFSVSEANGGAPLQNYTVKLGSTTQPNASAYISTPMTTVIAPFSYTATVQTAGNFDMIPFTSNFVWDGVSNIVVDICTGDSNPFSSPYGGVRVSSMTNGASYARCDGCTGGICSSATGTVTGSVDNAGYTSNRPNIQFNYTPGAACSGTPNSVIASAPTGVCPNTSFTLTATGMSVGSGLSYEWQYFDGSSWVSTGGTAPSYTVSAGISTQTDYRFITACSSGGSDTSNTVTVAINPFSTCYCTPVSNCTNEGIVNVTFDALNNSSVYCGTSGYADYTSLGALATVTQAQVIPITVSARVNDGGGNNAGVWIDYDHSGTFDATEYTSLGSTGPISTTPDTFAFTANISIPATALTGVTRMRVREANASGITAASACNTGTVYGEYEDYLITINAGTACSGQPSAGTISGPATVCPGTSFTLGVTGFTSGSLGLSYEWQAYDPSTTSWVAASGTNNGASYTVTGITVATDYRFVVSCSSGSGDTSVTFTVGVAPFNQCYCTPATTSSSYYINNFTTTNGISNINNTGSGYSTAGYGDFTSTQTVAVLEGGSFDFSSAYTGGTFGTKIWIDFNHNGLFTDAGEQVFVSTGYHSSESGTITIPSGALTGNTRMRIGANYNNSTGPANPCANFANGEYEDYTVNIIPLVACSGTPTPGTAYGPAAVCSGASFTLADTAYSFGTGLTYQWQESPSGAGVWSDILGATAATYTISAGITSATDYRFVVTCSNGGSSDNSNTVSVTLNPFYNCYCIPVSSCTNEGIDSVSFDALSNTSAYCATSGYTDYGSMGSLATVTQAQVIPMAVKAHVNSNPASVGVWIDYDHSGTFDASEYTSLGSSSGISPLPSEYIFSGNIIIPATAQTGITRMRVRSANQGGITATSACNTGTVYGEYEDYLITINAGTGCSGTPTAGTVTGSSTACAGGSFTLTASGFTNGSLGLNYEWQVFDMSTGSWIPATGGINNGTSYTDTTGVLSPTDYRFAVTCTNGGGQDFSSAFTVTPSVVTAFPFTEDFEPSSTTLPCWKIVNANGDGDAWTFANSATYAHSGTYKAQLYTDGNGGANDDWLISPAITLTGNQKLKYWYSVRSSGEPNDYTIKLSTTGNDPVDFTTVLKPLTSASNTTYQVDSVDLSAYTGTVFIAFHVPPGGLDGWYLYFDDISIEELPPACNGTPTAGTAYGPAGVCGNVPFTLSDTAYSFGPGISYQWQESPAGAGVWTDIFGATTANYTVSAGITTPMDYQLIVTCSNGGASDVSNTISIGINAPTQCYCTPYSGSSTSSDIIAGFQLDTLNNVTGGTNTNGYSDFTNMVVGLSQNVSYTANVTSYTGTLSHGIAIWIDLNDDGVFDATERLGTASNVAPSTTTPIAFTLSASTPLGLHRLRVMYQYNVAGPSIDPCVGVINGETEDYMVEINSAPACLPPSALVTSNTTATSTDVSWTENGTATQWSIEYGPSGFTQGAGTFVSAPTNPFTLPGLSAATTYDVYVRSVCSTTDSSTQAGPVSINTNQIPVTSYPYAINWDNGSGGWTYANGSQPNKWFVGTPGDNPAYATGTTPGGLYISNDGGVTNDYDNGSTSVVHAYRDLDLSSFSAAVPLTFNSYIVGEGATTKYDYLSVWIVPVTYEPVPGTNLNTVGSATQIGSSINLESGWTQHLLNIPASATGGTARLVLQWRNDGSSGSAPVKVDNLTIGGFPLVIKLRDINATNLGAKNRVDWSTESELKSDKFELERSADGRNFTYLATIKAKGEASNYSYMDLSPVTGVNYYRLKMIDAAGAVATSKVVTATVKQGAFTVEAYPNPVSEKLTIQVYGGSDQNATVAITDVTGKVMKVVSVVNGKVEVNMSGLASGVYLVKYTDSNHSQTIKVNKQ